jgi:hypothetical protein
MKMLIREVEGDGYVPSKTRCLSFKEFCQYVYEPSQRIKALNLSEEERLELEETIQRRKR